MGYLYVNLLLSTDLFSLNSELECQQQERERSTGILHLFLWPSRFTKYFLYCF